VVGSTTTHYVWEGDMVLAEYTAGSSTPTSEYVYAGSRMIARDASGTLSYYHKDRLSTRMVTSGSGSVVGTQSHYPFGEDAGTTGTETDKHRFTTYERDSESSLDYAVNRYENAALGRFQSADPVVDLSGPQRHNRYTYSANDPVNASDPTGLFSVSINSGLALLAAGYGPALQPESVDVTYVPDFAYYYYLPFDYSPIVPQPVPGFSDMYPGGVPSLVPPSTSGESVRLSGEANRRFMEESDRLRTILKDPNSSCSRFLLKTLGLKGSRIAKTVKNQRAFDATLSTLTLREAGIQPSIGILSDTPVNEFFAMNPGVDAAAAVFADSSDSGAQPFDVYYQPSSINATVILHESLHVFYGAQFPNDFALASALGVSPEEYASFGSRSINRVLAAAGCQ
jgi:RHS repeat-associated protein